MVEIQFENQGSPDSFKSEPRGSVVSEINPPEKSRKITPLILGILLALISGSILFAQVYLKKPKQEADETMIASREPKVQEQDLLIEESEPQNSRLTASVRPAIEGTEKPVTPTKEVKKPSTEEKTAAIVTKGGEVVLTPQTPVIVTPKPVSPKPVVIAPAVKVVNYGQLRGEVIVNGSVPDKSSILVLYRTSGQQNFTAGPRLKAENGVSWSFNLPTDKNYEIVLAWQINENNYITSQAVSVRAPSNLRTTFNFGSQASNDCQTCCQNCCQNCQSSQKTSYINKPDRPILDTCGSWSNDRHQAKLVLPKFVHGEPISYQVQIGSDQGRNDFYDHIFDQDQRVVFDYALENNKDYYIRFRVKTKNSGDSYGDWSDTLKFKCQR